MDLSPNQNSNADVEIADRGSWSTISGSSENNDGVPEAGQTLNNNAAVNAGPVAVQIEEETPPSYEQRKRPHNFQFEKKYPIRRFSRKWRRQEVQGFCCLAVEVVSFISKWGLEFRCFVFVVSFVCNWPERTPMAYE